MSSVFCLFQSLLLPDTNKLVNAALENIRNKCDDEIPKMCELRAKEAINSLLSEDCLPAVKAMCIQIAIRMAMEKINQWTVSHIADGSTFEKDLDLEISRASKSADELVLEKHQHDSQASSPTDILSEIRVSVLPRNGPPRGT